MSFPITAQAAFLPFWGIYFLWRHKAQLSRYVVPPMLIMLLLSALGIFYGLRYSASFIDWVWQSQDSTAWWVDALRSIALWLLYLVVIVLTAGVVYLISSVIASPFNDALSQRVEELLSHQPAARQGWGIIVQGLVGSVAVEALKLATFLTLITAALFASWMTGFGALAYPVISFGLTAIYLSLDCADFSAGRRFPRAAQRLRWYWQHKWPILSFGLTAAVLLWVPLINVLLLPAAVAGASRLVLLLAPMNAFGERAS